MLFFNILSKAPSWIMDNRKGQQFYIENPSYKGENFADKWNTTSERATAFFKWLDTARKDLVDGRLLQYNKIEMGNHLKKNALAARPEKLLLMRSRDGEISYHGT